MPAPIVTIFSKVHDPRVDRTKLHALKDILIIALLSTISGGDGWHDMNEFGLCKHDWLKTFLKLKHGIPSTDTFRRVISVINVEEFETCFREWVASVAVKCAEVIAIDGKAIRGSKDGSGNKSAMHMVSAWASENQLVLGQIAVTEKSNEITAIPKLIDQLDLDGCTVTIDAMGCQKDIAQKIIDAHADYIFSLKGNQGNMNDKVRFYMDDAIAHKPDMSFYEEVNSGHGRIEKRSIWYTEDVHWMEEVKSWVGLSGLVVVESQRTIKGVTTTERRYFITSVKGSNAKDIGRKIRSHWGVENSLHWCLDVSFGEDLSTIRKKNRAQNLSLIRKVALNLLKADTSKGSIRCKRKKSGWDNEFLANLLGI